MNDKNEIASIVALPKIEKVSDDSRYSIKRKTVYSLPDNPTAAGMKPAKIKKAFFAAIVDEALSVLAELDKVIDSVNNSLDKQDHVNELVKDFVTAFSGTEEYQTDAKKIIEAINELHTEIGGAENLVTKSKETLVGAINEICDTIGDPAELEGDNLIESVNQISQKVGNEELDTEQKENVIAAINDFWAKFRELFVGDINSMIKPKYLPSYVDDALEYDDFTMFPKEGERGKIYVDIKSNNGYRWSGSTYIRIFSGNYVEKLGGGAGTRVYAELADGTPTFKVISPNAISKFSILTRDGNGNCGIATPINSDHIANKGYVDKVAELLKAASEEKIAEYEAKIAGYEERIAALEDIISGINQAE